MHHNRIVVCQDFHGMLVIRERSGRCALLESGNGHMTALPSLPLAGHTDEISSRAVPSSTTASARFFAVRRAVGGTPSPAGSLSVAVPSLPCIAAPLLSRRLSIGKTVCRKRWPAAPDFSSRLQLHILGFQNSLRISLVSGSGRNPPFPLFPLPLPASPATQGPINTVTASDPWPSPVRGTPHTWRNSLRQMPRQLGVKLAHAPQKAGQQEVVFFSPFA